MPKVTDKRNVSVAASEVRRRFAQYLRQVERGYELTITRDGQPVARMSAIRQLPKGKERERAIAEMVRMMKRGLAIANIGWRLTRDEMHER